MKKHAIIPIFIPHLGCENDCVFCNQKIITAKSDPVSPNDAEQTILEYLSTLRVYDDIIPPLSKLPSMGEVLPALILKLKTNI